MSGRQQTLPIPGSGPIARPHPLANAVLDAWARAAQWHSRAAERRALAQLSDSQLQDIGITRAEADGEAGKWFWNQ
jgi:uncharacterized protein YjiS (DUF1127 family)